MKKKNNLRTIGAVFASLAMLTSAETKGIPSIAATPIGQEQSKQDAIPQDAQRKTVKKKEIDPQGGTADGIFRLSFHSSPIFSPTRSQRVKNKRTGLKRYFQK